MHKTSGLTLVKSSDTGAVKLYEDDNGWYEIHLEYEKFDFLMNDEATDLFNEYETLEEQIKDAETKLKRKKDFDYKLANGICAMRQKLRGQFKSEYKNLYMPDISWKLESPDWMEGAGSKERKEQWEKDMFVREYRKQRELELLESNNI